MYILILTVMLFHCSGTPTPAYANHPFPSRSNLSLTLLAYFLSIPSVTFELTVYLFLLFIVFLSLLEGELLEDRDFCVVFLLIFSLWNCHWHILYSNRYLSTICLVLALIKHFLKALYFSVCVCVCPLRGECFFFFCWNALLLLLFNSCLCFLL